MVLFHSTPHRSWARLLPLLHNQLQPLTNTHLIYLYSNGITVDLGFFKDVRIPEDLLPEPRGWHEEENDWAWHMEDEDPLYFERTLDIRFKVHAVRFNPMPTLQSQAQQREAGQEVEGTAERPYVPMQIIGKAEGDGLGMVHWYR